jgi:hypothetical protein
MAQAQRSDEQRWEHLNRLIKYSDSLQARSKAARQRADEAMRHAETLLERAAKRAAQWLDGQ